MTTKITSKPFGKTRDGNEVSLYLMRSDVVEVGVTNYGAIITSLKCADKYKKEDDIVTGFTAVGGKVDGRLYQIREGTDSQIIQIFLQGYENYPMYFGATVGRVCNRIAGAQFTLNGKLYNLAANNAPNSLHGGGVGFDKKIWDVEIAGENTLLFRLESKDGEEGYPGTLQVCTKYVLDGPQLLINYTANTDKETIVNITNHSYFNLAGHNEWNGIFDHKITINADKMLPTDATSIPTGEIKCVEETQFDLRKPTMLTQKRLESIPTFGGYDHNFCLSENKVRRLAARVEHEPSGRVMQIETTQPGIQFYTANKLSGVPGKRGKTYGKHSCFCLETQNWPDAINRVGIFPNVILKPGETYDQSTWLTFSTI